VPLEFMPEPLVAPFTPPFTEAPVVVLPVDRPPPVLGPAWVAPLEVAPLLEDAPPAV
jgi:hypothetical protein